MSQLAVSEPLQSEDFVVGLDGGLDIEVSSEVAEEVTSEILVEVLVQRIDLVL